MTTKDKRLESKDELKRRIDEAAKFAPLEQLALSPQCGFSSGIGGNVMTIEEEIAKLRRLVEVTKEVWGTT
jgi:5-methyltetrahydropteroyltriglutamate--homocysteine methyltransferase